MLLHQSRFPSSAEFQKMCMFYNLFIFKLVAIFLDLCSPLNTGLYHITGHQFESLVEMVAKLWVRPMEVADERLEGVELPEQVLGCCTAIAIIDNVLSNMNLIYFK